MNMNTKKALAVLALAASAAPAAFAGSGAEFVGGEQGFATHAAEPGLTREQVRRELLEFRKNPRGADGMAFVGGEIGYAPAAQAAPLAESAGPAWWQRPAPARKGGPRG